MHESKIANVRANLRLQSFAPVLHSSRFWIIAIVYGPHSNLAAKEWIVSLRSFAAIYVLAVKWMAFVCSS